MHQSKKGNDWHFGMKAHVGVDMATGLVHSVVGTAGNVADVTQTHALLHGGEKAVLGDAGYQGVGKRAENADKAIDWHVAMRPSVRKTLKKNSLGRATEKLEKAKASVRAKVEHCFHVVKCLFKHRKTRYRGLAKNNAQLFTLFGFANLVLARRFLGTVQSRCVLRSETDQKFSRNGRFEASKSRFDQKIAARETQSAKGLLSREKVNCSALP
jgi:IS5 family transposase